VQNNPRHAALFFITELVAVVCNLLFTWFYLNANPVCYAFGIAGPVLFGVLCYSRKIYAEILLQAVYVTMAVYGWLSLGQGWQEQIWTLATHVVLIAVGTLAVIGAGKWLSAKTDARLPYLDATTTVFGIIGTWAMVNYVHANWLYFIGINALSVVLYSRRKMYLGALMYALYFLMAIDGYFRLHWFSL
jgi:nicotinamide mononucleotide transporter